MVQRTNVFGDIVNDENDEENNEGYNLNVKPFRQPLLLIFLQDKPELIKRLGQLPKVMILNRNNFHNLINHCYHAIVSDITIIGQSDNISQAVLAIDFENNKTLPSNILVYGKKVVLYKMGFKDKSNNFIYEYLKEFLRVEEW